VGENLVIGVDLGGTKTLGARIYPNGDVERHHEVATPIDSQEDLLAGLDALVEELLDDDVKAIGFGIPSRIDQRTGRAVASVNIPLADLDFRDRMSERFRLPVGIDNDANAAAIAEWKIGAAQGANDVVMLTLGTGVGGGLILGGKPYRGSTGAGAELGHVVIVHDGRPCSCGGHGHIESYASGHAAKLLATEAFGEETDARKLVQLAFQGDEKAKEILADIGAHLGSGLGSIVNLFNPELIVVGGGFAASWHFISGPMEERMRAEALPPAKDQAKIVRAQLGTVAGVVGAGFVAIEALETGGGVPVV
jgi:glucokinase